MNFLIDLLHSIHWQLWNAGHDAARDFVGRIIRWFMEVFS